jgi:hypothetical protein
MNTKKLLKEFVPNTDQDGAASTTDDIDLARWIPRRIDWNDVKECVTIVLKREGVPE